MCFGGREKGDDTGAARSRELDKMIRADEKRMSKEVKLLLLGAHRYPWWRWGRTADFVMQQAPENRESQQSSSK
jgi:hypothetical protein